MCSFLAAFSCGNIQKLWWAGYKAAELKKPTTPPPTPPCRAGVSDNIMTLIKAGATFGVVKKENRSLRGRKSRAGLWGKTYKLQVENPKCRPLQGGAGAAFWMLIFALSRCFVCVVAHKKQPASRFLFDFFCPKLLPSSERASERVRERVRERASERAGERVRERAPAATKELSTKEQRHNGGHG